MNNYRLRILKAIRDEEFTSNTIKEIIRETVEIIYHMKNRGPSLEIVLHRQADDCFRDLMINKLAYLTNGKNDKKKYTRRDKARLTDKGKAMCDQAYHDNQLTDDEWL